jgi:hypothetical protein
VGAGGVHSGALPPEPPAALQGPHKTVQCTLGDGLAKTEGANGSEPERKGLPVSPVCKHARVDRQAARTAVRPGAARRCCSPQSTRFCGRFVRRPGAYRSRQQRAPDPAAPGTVGRTVSGAGRCATTAAGP